MSENKIKQDKENGPIPIGKNALEKGRQLSVAPMLDWMHKRKKAQSNQLLV